ncbi:MAG TPA: hypothetical protein ENN56_01295, partial [Firmicutes bacterium]|nr:hypothetical protein [Bacillota bacterium]
VTLLLTLCASVFVVPIANAQLSSQDCLDCHGDADIMEGMESYLVQPGALDESVHAFFECTDCHNVTDIPHDDLGPPTCASCHDMAQEEFDESVHGMAFAKGEPEAPGCGSCHGGHTIRYVDDPTSLVAPRKQPATCGTCHSNPDVVRKYYMSAANPSEAYERSAHYAALMREGDDAPEKDPPTCSTCHGAHAVQRASNPDSPVYAAKVGELCGRCHTEIYDIYAGSVHGQAHSAGNRNAPTCVSCHGEHNIVTTADGRDIDEIIRLSSETCATCHADQQLIRNMGLSALRVTSYRESYHGLAGQAGSEQIARCASCHGVHNIYRARDPRSLVHENNLVFTCGNCHEGINDRFAQIRVHALYTTETTTPAGIVRVTYIFLIVSILGGMMIHNFVIYSRYIREKYRAEKRLRRLRRFPRFQLTQHIILILSFMTLAITGFALKYGGSFWVEWLQSVGFDEATRRLTHRFAAVVLMVQSVVQMVWFVITREGRRDVRSLIPTYQDVIDAIQNMRYHLFHAEHPPRYGRFDYVEKAEYLALIWGTAVMAITGLVLWFPELATRFWPAWTIEVATMIHYYEAILATAAIFVWHWFFVIYHPREFPMRLTWLTGAMTEHDYRHHHPREYEELRNNPDVVLPPQHDTQDRRESNETS